MHSALQEGEAPDDEPLSLGSVDADRTIGGGGSPATRALFGVRAMFGISASGISASTLWSTGIHSLTASNDTDNDHVVLC